MIINFKVYRINQDIYKLVQTFTVIKKKNKDCRLYNPDHRRPDVL